jgi:hypothetical protein
MGDPRTKASRKRATGSKWPPFEFPTRASPARDGGGAAVTLLHERLRLGERGPLSLSGRKALISSHPQWKEGAHILTPSVAGRRSYPFSLRGRKALIVYEMPYGTV